MLSLVMIAMSYLKNRSKTMNILFIISKVNIPDKDIITAIQKTAAALKLSFREEDDENFVVCIPNFGDLLEIALEDFKRGSKSGDYPNGYGPVFSIWYNNGGQEEDTTVIPFLKEFLKHYPEMQVLNDEDTKSPTPHIFTKAHIDAIKTNNCYEGLFRSPE
jgi:hypothetical protein